MWPCCTHTHTHTPSTHISTYCGIKQSLSFVFQTLFRMPLWTMWRMLRSAHGKRSKSNADTRLVDAAAAVDQPMCPDPSYGFRIMQFPNAPAATRSSGWVDESITVGVYFVIHSTYEKKTATETNCFNMFCSFFSVVCLAVCGVTRVVSMWSRIVQFLWADILRWLFRILGGVARWKTLSTRSVVRSMLSQCNH